MITLEEVLSPENMQTACRRVIANKGAPGIDGMTVNEVRAHFEKHGAAELRSSLRNFESQNEYGYKPCIKRRFQNAETLQSRNQTNSS